MSGSYTVPSNSVAAGTAGHAGDHNNLATVLSGMPYVVFNVLNTAYAGGADPTGTSDCTAAFQAALNAIVTAGGGILYVPKGNYLINSALTFTSAKSLMILGDGPNASVILLNSSSTSIVYLTITNSNRVMMRDISLNNNINSSAFSNTNVAVELVSCNWGAIYNVGMQTGAATNRVNQGFIFNGCNNITMSVCDIRAYVNAVYITGASSAVFNINTTNLSCNKGSGQTYGSVVLVDDNMQTLHMSQVVIGGGDWGVYLTAGAGGTPIPAFFVFYDVEINNPGIGGMVFELGSEIWMSECWLSILQADVVGTEHGIVFGSSFNGQAYLAQCTFQGFSGHSIWIEGGSGFAFSDCVLGNGVKNASNTFDEIHIASGSAFTTINSCHFNTDPHYAFTSTPARSAVYCEAGAGEVTITGCMAAATANYGTAALCDFTNNVVRKGNIGFGLADSTCGTGNTVTTASSFVALTGTVTTPPNDATLNAVYRITAWGHGTQATGSAQNLTLRFTINGGGLGTFTAGTNPAAGASFSWNYVGLLVITGTGTGGTAALNDNFTWAGVTTTHGNSSASVNTTTTGLLGLYAEWAATTGGPTITCDGFMIERLQNNPSS